MIISLHSEVKLPTCHKTTELLLMVITVHAQEYPTFFIYSLSQRDQVKGSSNSRLCWRHDGPPLALQGHSATPVAWGRVGYSHHSRALLGQIWQ